MHIPIRITTKKMANKKNRVLMHFFYWGGVLFDAFQVNNPGFEG